MVVGGCRRCCWRVFYYTSSTILHAVVHLDAGVELASRSPPARDCLQHNSRRRRSVLMTTSVGGRSVGLRSVVRRLHRMYYTTYCAIHNSHKHTHTRACAEAQRSRSLRRRSSVNSKSVSCMRASKVMRTGSGSSMRWKPSVLVHSRM